jgi:hypothetical protein
MKCRWLLGLLTAGVMTAQCPLLLVLEKGAASLAFVDPESGSVLGHVDLGTLEVTRRISTGADPDGMAWINAK